MSNTPSLLPCPFCGAPAHGYAIAPHSHSPAVLRLIPELPDHPGSYVIEGQCACGSGLIGANESEMTARWNRRTPQPVVREPLPKFTALRFRARRDKKAEVTLLFQGHETADAWVRGITKKGGSNAE